MKNQAYNPYLPSYEYIPDGEPHVFDDRLYIFGSHDCFNGAKFCLGDYVTWSAPINDLSDFRFEGTIYKKTQDSDNLDGSLELWAPDVVKGLDGRYYLYYCLANYNKIGVAVCNTPSGQYEFLSYVHYADGTPYGQKDNDDRPFDPAVLVDDNKVYLYTGQGPAMVHIMKHKSMEKKASVVMELQADMITIKSNPKRLMPLLGQSEGTVFEGHEFFEGSSIRKFGSLYYFIYSSGKCHELCYATSNYPDKGFVYRGTLISNGDIGYKGLKDQEALYFLGNNHGSIVEINKVFYVFYHRHTNKHSYSRQGCSEVIHMRDDQGFDQVEMTSCGLNNAPLLDSGVYESRIACNLIPNNNVPYLSYSSDIDLDIPYITQSEEDGKSYQYIANMKDGSIVGFKYFEFKSAKQIIVKIRGTGNGILEVRDGLNNNIVSLIQIKPSPSWSTYKAPLNVDKGIKPLYFTYNGQGYIDFLSFELK